MLLSKGSVNLRSLGLSPFVLALGVGLTGSVATGCFFIEEGDHYYHDDYDDPNPETPDPEPNDITTVSIQPDQVLDAKPGEGVGIFVEYATGGKWHVWTTCDTFVSKQVCSFQIYAGARRAQELLAYATDDVEGFDEVSDLGDGTVQLLVDTDSDTDHLLLELNEGSQLQLEVYLDGQSAESFVYWVSDDVIHAGAPANPVGFVPALAH